MSNSKITKQKWCWVATQTKDGWRLKIAIGNKDIRLEGLLLVSVEEVKKVAKGNIVFVHKKTITTVNKIKNR